MVNYTLLYKDEKTQISYFYNLDTHSVYTDRKPINKEKITTLSFLGAFLAVLVSPIIVVTKMLHMTILTIVLVGTWMGWIISLLIIKHSERYFIEENKQELTNEEIRKMYIAGADFRKKYRLLLGWLFVFNVISTAFLSGYAVNTYVLIALILLWAIAGMMYFINRPICSRRIKKLMK